MNGNKKPYPYDDKILFEIVEEGDIHLQVLSNEKGTFIDIRKYFSGKPSKKGIRIPVEIFERLYQAYMKSNYDKLNEGDIKEDDKKVIMIELDKKNNNGTFKKIKK